MGRTTFRQEKLSSSRVKLNIKDIYYGVENMLDDFGYRFDSGDVEEYVASILDMYLDTSDRGLGRAMVDLRSAHTVFNCLMQSIDGTSLTRIHNERLVKFVMDELSDYVKSFDIVRVYDYTIYGFQLVLECIRRVEIKAVA